ncbi:hypothetical protein [Pandoraea apista]|uniref:Bbp19-like phage domain-containing protein n=1 Tax=Pandoraea apista TaxID=93218 RepID=A0ABX9ZIH0_9BURK|nr:hypothetical protein [Pandoraea apista]RRJ26338.1 hypothetical protein EIB05_23390 [Pandoraea apista]RRJ72901.1 hypothetical protein EIL82_23345 [Pandoraea apista]RSC97854.1 hypothetical protein EJB12_23895 [Pandoraea apista]RSD08293.1 hypothetical protein EIZ52_24625 [Pandoraea apista]RSK75273.1 hypothetical protein EJE83_24260 [Pandoraea apista]
MSIFDRILRRRSYYRATFQGDAARHVLADLRRFCRHGESPLVVSTIRQQADPIATAVQIGRQEVFQRIIAHLHIDDAQLLKLKEEAENE